MKTSKWLVIVVIVLALLVLANIVYALVGTSRQTAQQPDQRQREAGPVVRVKSEEEKARMEQYIADYYAPLKIVETLQVPWGETIDCVDINTQPALQRPEMRGHEIRLRPSEIPAAVKEGQPLPEGLQVPVQEYLLVGGPCPEGSIPLRRLTIDTLIRFETLDDFFRKELGTTQEERWSDARETGRVAPPLEPPCGDDGSSGSSTHEYAHARQDIANLGAESRLGLWNTWVEWSNEFALSQIWVVRGSGADRETLEAGWQSYYDKYGDWNAHLFIYFTPDNYGSGGCYNLDCSGFVQTNNAVYLGGGFTNVSAYGDGSNQWYIKLMIARDPGTALWWLWWFDEPVGYWPTSLFDASGLANRADIVDFGGEIVNTFPDGRHTYTDMGSGNWPGAGWTWAGWQSNIQYVDTNYVYQQATLWDSRTDSDCYDIILVNNSGGSWGTYFYFGGPGWNTNCP